MKVSILGVGLDSITPETAVEEALACIRDRRGGYVCTPNPEMLWLAHGDGELRSIINRAVLVLPDGVGDLLAARMLGQTICQRVTGVDFALGLLEKMQGSLFLLGGKPGVAERAAENIRSRFPQIQIAGLADGFSEPEEMLMARVQRAAPDFVMVCLGMGRQERFMARLAGDERIGLMAGLGGTMDVLAGDIPKAPDFYIRHNIEWLYRLLKQPKRIVRLLRLPLFLAAVCIQRVKYGKR